MLTLSVRSDLSSRQPKLRESEDGNLMTQTTQTAPEATTTTPSSPSSGTSVQRKAIARGGDFVTQMKALTPRDSAPVQRHGSGENSNDVHAAATAGTAGAGGAMPHLSAIQNSFGGHDVSNVQAHVGGAAKDASAAMGAEAYASGNHVAFADTPSLHTAAHEAAHVVQQQAGVSLSGGVGQAGDRYEQHADQVADAVVQGKSAEGILDKMSGAGGGGTVQRRAVQRNQIPPQNQAPPQLNGVNGTINVVPQLQSTLPPEQFTGSMGVYNANAETVKGRMLANSATNEDVAKFEGKKGEWYHRWGVAALQPLTGTAAAAAEFVSIRAGLAAMFPEDSPSEGGGHLYTGRTTDPTTGQAQTGRQRAESTMEQANADPQNQQAHITHRTLETTCMGNLFDNITGNRPDPVEQAKWIPWNDNVKDNWWGHISGEYANTFTGDVHAHIDIGFAYFTKQLASANPGMDHAGLVALLPTIIKLDRGSVFGGAECDRIGSMMGAGKVTSLVAHLRCETSPGVFKSGNPSIPAQGVASGEQLRVAIDQAILSLVSPADLVPNLPAPPPPPNANNAIN